MEVTSFEEHIRHQFDAFCKKVLKFKARDIYRQYARQVAQEISLSEVHNTQFSHMDKYFTGNTSIQGFGNDCTQECCRSVMKKVKGKSTIYAGKDACRQFKNRCTSGRGHKTVSLGQDADCVPVKMYGDSQRLQQIPENARISVYNHTLDRTVFRAEEYLV